MNIFQKLEAFVSETFKTTLEIFLEALRMSPNAQGYVSGSISELILKNYEDNVLPGSKSMIITATNQMLKGEINYMEWSWIMNQALESRLDYLDKVKSYNDGIIQILYQTIN